MKVFFIPKGDENVPSSRYRCYFFAEALRRNGIVTEICAPPLRQGLRPRKGMLQELARLLGELRKVGPEDVIYLQRTIYNTPFVLVLALDKILRRRKMIFDFCDPIFLHSPKKASLLARLADRVVASCEDLAVWARQYNAAVEVVPNSVREEEIASSWQDGEGEKVSIGWIGNAKLHEENLRALFPVLRRLPEGCVFRLIGAKGAEHLVRDLRALPGVDVEVIEWLKPDEVGAELARLHVAALPVQDIPWNRKLLTKLMEYMAAGIPTVASPVGENRFAIEDGKNGFLASDEGEWVEKLGRLVADRDLRRRLGEEALATMRRAYALDVSGRRLTEIVRGLGRPT